MNNIVFLVAYILIIFQASAQYQSGWDVPLKESPTSMRIVPSDAFSQQRILLGFATGQLIILDAHSKQAIKTLSLFNEAITHIEVDSTNGISFIASSLNIASLDHQYNIRKILKFNQTVKRVTLSNFNGAFYANFQVGDCVYNWRYFDGNSETGEERDVTTVWKTEEELSVVQVSLHHQYFYTVDKERKQFSIRQLSPVSSENSSAIHKLTDLTTTSRKFNFKIMDLLVDRKGQVGPRDEDLILLTQDGTIFYIRSGNILTYIPYSISSNERLITADYCQNMFIVILHERRISTQPEYFLTLIRKDNLLSHKVIMLSQHFGNMKGVVRMDCNSNLIVIQSQDKRLLVLESYKIFSIVEYSAEIMIAIGVIFAVLYLYRLLTRKRQHNSDNVQTKLQDNPSPTKQGLSKDQVQAPSSKQPKERKKKRKDD